MTKDHLEMKRSKAQENNTTYVYDYPELFRINVVASWKDHITRYILLNDSNDLTVSLNEKMW